MSALRELFAVFRTEVDTKPLDKADKRVDQFRENLRSLGEAVASAFALREIAMFVKETIEAGDALADMAAQLQVTTADLQFMQYAMKLTGGETEDAAVALKFLTKNLGEAAQGAGTAGETFAKLHVQIKNGDGSTRASTEVLTDLADAFAKSTDPAKATADAMAIFGKQGIKLIPLLKQGSAGIAKMREEFQALGGGMSDEFIKAADDAQDEIDKLGFSWVGLKSTIVLFFIPAIEDATQALQKWMKGTADFIRETGGFKTAIQALGLATVAALVWKLVAAFRALGVAEVVAEFAGFAVPLLIISLLYLAFDELVTLMGGGKTIIGEFLDEFAGFGAQKEVVQNLKDLWTEFMAVFGSDDAEEATGFLDFMEKVLTSLIVETANLLNIVLTLVTAVLDLGKAFGQIGGAGIARLLSIMPGGAGMKKTADDLTADAGKSLGGAGRALNSGLDTTRQIVTADVNQWRDRHLTEDGKALNGRQFKRYQDARETLGYVPGSSAIEFGTKEVSSDKARSAQMTIDKLTQPVTINITNPTGSAREVADAARSGTKQGVGEANRATLAAVESGG